MDLIRLGQRSSFQNEDALHRFAEGPDETKAIRAIFRSFGCGSERTSDFAVDLNWGDIETLIREFAEMKHPAAVRLQSAVKLAAAANEAGWQSEDLPQSN